MSQTAEANLARTLKNRDWEPSQRARVLQQEFENDPEAARRAVSGLLADHDELAKVEQFLKEMKQGPAVPEYIVEKKGGLLGSSCIVTSGANVAHVPVDPEFIEGRDILPGTPVLVSQQFGLIVGKNEAPVKTGVATTVEKVMDNGQCIIDHSPEKLVCHVAAAIKDRLKSGDKVVVNVQSRFVLDILESTSDVSQVFVPLSEIDSIDLSVLAELNPAIDEIMVRAEALAKHPQWIAALGVRPTCSYMFCGPTGTGKTTALNIIAKRLADWSGECGKRESRLVRADTSTFFTSLFGETEQRIRNWFDKIRAAGAFDTKVPLLVVLEEAEALFRARGSDDASSHLFDRPLSLFLSQASSIGQELKSPLIFVITSNQPKLMDAAALRRFGMRRIEFGYLSKEQAGKVLQMRLPSGVSANVVHELLAWLYDEEDALAEVTFGKGKRPLKRSDLVTPAIIEESISQAADDCLRDSVRASKLSPLEAKGIGRRMEGNFHAMVRMLSDNPRNLEQLLPSWKAEHGNAAAVTVL